MPKPFDLVSTCVCLAVLIPFLYNKYIVVCGCGATSPWSTPLLLASIAGLLGIDRLEYWLYEENTPTRPAIVLMIIRIILIEIASQSDHFMFSAFLYLILPFLSYVYFGNAVAWGMMAWTCLIYLIKMSVYTRGWWYKASNIHDMILFFSGVVFAMAMARVVLLARASRMRTEQLLSELGESHQQLKAYAEQVEELATTRERNRLARDIHDSLGHYLTIINVQLEKSMAFREKRPQEAEQALSDAKRLASEALQDVRHSVGALRATRELFVLAPALAELIEHVRGEQGMVELRIEGSEEGFSKPRLLTLYRVAQEGLTNVQRHARATHVLVEMCFGEREACLSLSDDGCGFDPASAQSEQIGPERSYGLQGIRERLELVGGSLHIESSPGSGTHLSATVPKDDHAF